MPVAKGKEGMRSCMLEWKKGELHSGGSGKVVKDRKQAIAICLNQSGQSRGQQRKK